MPTFNMKYIFNEKMDNSPDNYEVNPETITQYTGLKDENGKKIFEGDILKVTSQDVFEGRKYYSIMSVIYDSDSFCIESDFENIPLMDYYGTFEVIGNRFETPELLKGE